MAVTSQIMKGALAACLALAAAAAIPVLPNPPVAGDPVAPVDPRVDVGISAEDLAAILQLARGKRRTSVHQRYFVTTDLPLRSVTAAKPSLQISPGRLPVKEPPFGDVEATFYAESAPGYESGVTYYFIKRGKKWRISKTSHWVV